MACVFCAIASGGIPSAKLHEDDAVLAFLDVNPLTKGHALVIPRAHAARLEDVPAATAHAMMDAAQRLLPALAAATGAPDATLALHNGPAAGQEVAHAHLHLVPRGRGDGGGPVHALFAHRHATTPDALAALAADVRLHLEET